MNNFLKLILKYVWKGINLRNKEPDSYKASIYIKYTSWNDT